MLLAAVEAHNKTQKNIYDCVTSELNKLSEQINNAIAEGKYSITNDGYLQQETRQRLEELGYKIQTGSQYNESYYSISWK
jgi:predicted kinase